MGDLQIISADDFFEKFDDFDNKIVIEMIERFLYSYKKRLSDMESFIQTNNYSDFERISHGLKGIIGVYCAYDLCITAGKLEKLASLKDQENIRPLFNEFNTNIITLAKELEELKEEYS